MSRTMKQREDHLLLLVDEMTNPEAAIGAPLPRRFVGWSTRAALSLIVLGLSWWTAIHYFDVPPYLAPGPYATFEAIVQNSTLILEHLRVTLVETLSGLLISTTLALSLAILFTSSPSAETAVMPFAIALRSTPIVAIAPLIMLIAGRGLQTGIICVTIVSFFPTLVNATRGFRATTTEMRELLHVVGASRPQAFRLVRFPVALPFIFAGLRTAASVAVLGALVAEWLTGAEGLGRLMITAATFRDLPLLWGVALVSTALALTLFWLMQGAERALLTRMTSRTGQR